MRYNGRDLPQSSPILECWEKEGRLVSFCPEVEAGLPTPRACVEIIPGTERLEDETGKDYSDAFQRGARLCLELCRRYGIKTAILAENSPSCGSTMVYDGSFTGRKIPGQGVTAALLASEGIRVYSQHKLDKISARLDEPGK